MTPQDEMRAEAVRAVMAAVEKALEGVDATDVEKACGAFHAAIGKCALVGMSEPAIRESFEIVMKYNPAMAMVSLVPSGRA